MSGAPTYGILEVAWFLSVCEALMGKNDNCSFILGKNTFQICDTSLWWDVKEFQVATQLDTIHARYIPEFKKNHFLKLLQCCKLLNSLTTEVYCYMLN